MSAPNLQVLTLLLERAAAERDEAAQALQGALAQANNARHQHEQLTSYRQEFQQRWTSSFTSQAAAMDIVGCYQSFGQRLDQAVHSQHHVSSHADSRVEQARQRLLAAELRVAGIQKLIELRQAEQRQAAQRLEQRHADEFAARVHAKQAHSHLTY
jgi:flagellar FliJ protein